MKYHFINPDLIHKTMLNDTNMVRQFVDMYISQCPADFQKLIESVEKEHFRNVADAAHHIKPTMEYIGATALRIDFQELENLARQEEVFTDIREKFEYIQAKFRELMEELRVFREEL